MCVSQLVVVSWLVVRHERKVYGPTDLYEPNCIGRFGTVLITKYVQMVLPTRKNKRINKSNGRQDSTALSLWSQSSEKRDCEKNFLKSRVNIDLTYSYSRVLEYFCQLFLVVLVLVLVLLRYSYLNSRYFLCFWKRWCLEDFHSMDNTAANLWSRSNELSATWSNELA